jgi:hypothetical protein
MKKLESIVLLFLMLTTGLSAQKFNVEYTTVTDTLEPQHLLTFKKDGTAILRFPSRPGVYWDSLTYMPLTYSFSNIGDTLFISSSTVPNALENSIVVNRIQNAKFVVKPRNQLLDLNSGYTYLPYRQTKRMKYGAIAFENKIYLIKRHRSTTLKHKFKNLSLDDFKTNILRGKKAFDKYGIKGINGVIEIEKQ